MGSVLDAGLQKEPHYLGSPRVLEFRRSRGDDWVAQGQDLLFCPRTLIITLSSRGNHFKIYYELPRCQIVETDVWPSEKQAKIWVSLVRPHRG